jgi:hypothetical protein
VGGNVQPPPPELTLWGREKLTWNRGSAGAVRANEDPVYHCYPPGLVRLGPPLQVVFGGTANAIQILQSPTKVTILYQFRHEIRNIYMDGRGHPEDLQTSWNGHSIGKWDGDTLVVDTVGLRTPAWLDKSGREFSPRLRVVERYRRVSADRLELERTLSDPIALARPHTTRAIMRLSTSVDLNENFNGKQYDCTQFMVRKPNFGEGGGDTDGLMGISEPTSEKY